MNSEYKIWKYTKVKHSRKIVTKSVTFIATETIRYPKFIFSKKNARFEIKKCLFVRWALCYKPEGREFDSRLCHLNVS